MGQYTTVTASTDGFTATTDATIVRITANDNRRAFVIGNLSSSVSVYVSYTTGATSTTAVKLAPNGIYADDVYNGNVYVFTSSGTADCGYTEVG